MVTAHSAASSEGEERLLRWATGLIQEKQHRPSLQPARLHDCHQPIDERTSLRRARLRFIRLAESTQERRKNKARDGLRSREKSAARRRKRLGKGGRQRSGLGRSEADGHARTGSCPLTCVNREGQRGWSAGDIRGTDGVSGRRCGWSVRAPDFLPEGFVARGLGACGGLAEVGTEEFVALVPRCARASRSCASKS